MTILKIAAVAMLTAIVALYLKKYTPETAILASVAGGLLIIFLISDYLFGVIEYLRDFFVGAGMDSGVIKIVLKVTIIAYLIEFTAGMVRDLGETSLSEKVLLCGKIVILTLTIPVIKSVFDLISELVKI